jgi:hypothetical protein
MTLVVEAPDRYEAERRYILDVILSDWLSLDWRLEVGDRSDVRIRADGDASGRSVVLPDVLFATAPDDWLAAASLPSEPLHVAAVDGASSAALRAGERLPVLFGARPAPPALLSHTAEGSRVEVDVFGAAFFMLTRYEEVVVADRDEFGRFAAASSLAARAGFLRTAIVDAYADLLWSALTHVWPRLERRRRAYGVIVSHDVDDPLSTLGRRPADIARQLAADVIARRDLRLALRRGRSLVAGRRGNHRLDPYNTFDFMMDVSDRNGLTSAFYFLAPFAPTPQDGPYRIDDPWIGALIGHIHRRGHEVGLHGSFHSYDDPKRTQDEFSRLRAVAERHGVRQERWGGRQHYLRWANPLTWRNWNDAGLSYDTTVAYADAVGFRTGTSHPYRVFDLEARRALELRELPFQVMDVTLFSYMALSAGDAHAAVMEIAAECRRHGGSLGILWHNSAMPSDRQRRWYASMIGAVSNP